MGWRPMKRAGAAVVGGSASGGAISGLKRRLNMSDLLAVSAHSEGRREGLRPGMRASGVGRLDLVLCRCSAAVRRLECGGAAGLGCIDIFHIPACGASGDLYVAMP